MALSYALGVDGGGSKTACALFTASGAAVELLQWGTTSHEFLRDGYEGSRRELGCLLDTLTRRTGIPLSQMQAVMGLAGVDCRRQAALFTEMALNLGLGRALVVNDSLLGLKAGAAEGYGIAVCNGTGTGASGIDPGGRTASAGSLFELSGDYAGGRILGAEVVRSVYDQCVRGGPATAMTPLLLRAVGAASWEEALETVVCGCADGTIRPKETSRRCSFPPPAATAWRRRSCKRAGRPWPGTSSPFIAHFASRRARLSPWCCWAPFSPKPPAPSRWTP